MVPERKLNPKASFCREGREQMALNGRVPDKPCFERSISVTFRAVLQETPVKSQVGLEGIHVEKRLGLEDLRVDLRVRRESSSSDEAVLEKQRIRKRRKKQGSSGGIIGGGNGGVVVSV